jgi:phosphinothricin acetyltransferase
LSPLRPARPGDVPAITAIYNRGIAEREATFETRARGEAEVAAWLDGAPLLVAEQDGEVVGFARVTPYSDREAYAGIGEYGIYLAPAARGRGTGAALLDALATAAEAAGYHKLTAKLFTSNEASHALARRCGFRVVGVHRRHGRLDGRWRDVTVVERVLGDAPAVAVGPLEDEHRAWADALVDTHWGRMIVRLGEVIDDITPYPTLVATLDGEPVGALIYGVRGPDCEVMSLISEREGHGVARALLDAARERARAAGCRRMWLITTNDNLRALQLYQRWGFDIVALNRGAVDESRRTVKPSIPPRAGNGIRIAHELELELRLDG